MTKQNKQIMNYSKLSLSDIIKIETGKDVSFQELEYCDQEKIFDFIKNNNVKVKVLGYKWYDILSNMFFVIEYPLNQCSKSYITSEKKLFNTFEEFFEYVEGDIYKDSCFYGYSFSKDEILKHKIDASKLNFEAFVTETIDDYTFEKIATLKADKATFEISRANEMLTWLMECEPITNLYELEIKKKEFDEKFNWRFLDSVFFFMLIKKDPNIIQNAVLEYVCKDKHLLGFSFEDALFTYGKKAALYVIENYDGPYQLPTRKKKIRNFQKILELYENGLLDIQMKRGGFDPDIQLYYVLYSCSDGINYPTSFFKFFVTFEEFIDFLNGDLSGIDLSNAPVSKEKIFRFKTDNKTKLPLNIMFNHFSVYEVEKGYSNKNKCFSVSQSWFDDNGKNILFKYHSFDKFFDLVHFLKGNLSNANFLFCDGIENIKTISGLNLNGIKIRSEIATKLGLAIEPLSENALKFQCFDDTIKNEAETIDSFLIEHSDSYCYDNMFSFITDIHLDHKFEKFKCRTIEDIEYTTSMIAEMIGDNAISINLIGGDTSSNFHVFKIFIKTLANCSYNNFFFVLGNHELSGFPVGVKLQAIIDKYKTVLQKEGEGRMFLVQNNLYYKKNMHDWSEITEEELYKISHKDLKTKLRDAQVIIFGGLGFAGTNESFNADSGIYNFALNREEEKSESNKFRLLHNKVIQVAKNKNLIVLTHMPINDWGGENVQATNGVVYVNGHTHRNYFYDDGNKRIYADNQVGYTINKIALKQVYMDFSFDWFVDYEDGIYEINRDDYLKFYIGAVGTRITFNRPYKKLYMIKREKIYMFLMQNAKGVFYILNGGAIKKANSSSLEYYYDRLVNYAKSVSMYLYEYQKFQNQVSFEVKKIGGSGIIHGCIVDIDLWNHLYLNPFDGSITPYTAFSMVDKYVYKNIPSLLKYACPKLFENYEQLLAEQNNNNAIIVYDKNLSISSSCTYVGSTDMYKISRIIRGLQYTTKYNIVRLWNDNIASSPTKENGRLIVSNLANLDLI